MEGLPADFWSVIALLLHMTAAIGAATLAIWLWPRASRLGAAGGACMFALAFTAVWSLAEAIELRGIIAGPLLETGRNLIWLFVVYKLFAGDARDARLGPVRAVLYALTFVELLLLGLDLAHAQAVSSPAFDAAVFGLGVMLRLLVTVGALVLVHNLYGGAPPETRLALRWPTAGLAAIWIFDLNLYTIAYLTADWPREIAALRGLATVALVSFLAIGASQGRDVLRLRPSREATFQTFSLLLIGSYLVAMVLLAQWLSFFGGDFERLINLAFLTVTTAVALLVLPSRRLRGWLRVTLTKHLFQHRYDYREEWLRLTRTIGATGPDAPPLGERVVQALADTMGSPGGALLVCDEGESPVLAARWNWIPASSEATLNTSFASFIERECFIAELDSWRAGAATPPGGVPAPEWLLADQRAWAVVPLIHYDRLVGAVVLARPPQARKLDWEDFDLLRVIGQQLASYLAENATQEALAEASQFDEFNRRIAFVMHDIKNLASQFSLLARNAELHAEKKAFRDDMIVTLRSSSEKLNALMTRLSRYGSGSIEKLEPLWADEVARTAVGRFGDTGQVLLAECEPLCVTASRHSLEQVLVHLVQNGLDASPSGNPVLLSAVREGGQARFDVVDSGSGMSPEFVRTRLFKPFVSTKSGGFGIGAFEARELVRAMRGRLDVESREGLGTRFVVRIPLAAHQEERANLHYQQPTRSEKAA
ncbi:XrtA/PEP-CTERM system histidine kinase PrsK [Novosphingobium sp. M1R2S20]|uniref:histidine kinase n=1 Tax=Novosphingobium rhizovicinum TaxID=3228928 RepID=A0ABV3RBP3_9SPHN